MSKGILFFLSLVIIQTVQAQEIANSSEEVCPLKIGSTIPEATLLGVDGNSISIQELIKEKPTLLIFYRGSWCPYCNVHLAGLQEAEEQIIELGFQIIAVSPDLPENLQKSVEKNTLTYTLLSDSDLAFTKMMGLAFRVDQKTLDRYDRINIDLEAASGQSHKSLPVPAAYLIDKKGLVHFNYVNPNYKVRIKPGVLLAAAKSMVD